MSEVAVCAQHRLPEQLGVLITGAASGIGYAQAEAFIQKGHLVYGVDLQEGNLATLAKKYPNRFRWQVADITQTVQVAHAVADCVDFTGDIHILCNTAGILDGFAPLDRTTYEQWQQVMTTNVTGMFLVTQATLPHLLAQPTSRVINMASIAGLTAGGGGIAYTTAKHAVVGFTKQLAYDYSQQGLRANAIAPGAIQTAMTASDFEGDATLAQWVADQVPIKRWAQAEEVAQFTLFLASDAADYMQGNIIPFDGGWMIR
ncbi:MAG: 3-oxoacyl-ACP reductase [Aerococcaceae bacterium]|nr:3-oxoacyl-ACP reductase [Aerococcaceae bacterium]